jgi:hypothetical protein
VIQVSAASIRIRPAEPYDNQPIISVLNDWWGGRAMTDVLPKLFFVHFQQTSFIAEKDGALAGFLIGLFSQTFSNESYIHFVGVNPSGCEDSWDRSRLVMSYRSPIRFPFGCKGATIGA